MSISHHPQSSKNLPLHPLEEYPSSPAPGERILTQAQLDQIVELVATDEVRRSIMISAGTVRPEAVLARTSTLILARGLNNADALDVSAAVDAFMPRARALRERCVAICSEHELCCMEDIPSIVTPAMITAVQQEHYRKLKGSRRGTAELLKNCGLGKVKVLIGKQEVTATVTDKGIHIAQDQLDGVRRQAKPKAEKKKRAGVTPTQAVRTKGKKPSPGATDRPKP